MDIAPQEEPVRIGGWTADRRSGELSGPDGLRSVEPKVMDLLFLLASRPGEVFSKEEIGRALWPDVTVGEDSLTRCVFKLRRALGDDPKAPRYVETIPKRGYRLRSPEVPPDRPRRPGRWITMICIFGVLAAMAGVYLWDSRTVKISEAEAAAMTAQADNLYFQINRADNDVAIVMYEQVLDLRPDHAAAQAGLANALVQKVIRWSRPPGPADAQPTDLGRALGSGVTRTPDARRLLGRASRLAEAAVKAGPKSAAAWKALGFVRAAQGDFAAAIKAQETAARLDPDAWDALINLADVHALKGDHETSIAYLERAYAAMTRDLVRRPGRVRPWYAETGALIGRQHEEAGRPDQAEQWYRRVLARSPLFPDASVGLARVLAVRGDRPGAEKLCRDLIARTGPNAQCAAITD